MFIVYQTRKAACLQSAANFEHKCKKMLNLQLQIEQLQREDEVLVVRDLAANVM